MCVMGMGGNKGGGLGHETCLSEQPLHVLKPCFLGGGCTSPAGAVENKTFVFLRFHLQPLVLLY